RIEDATNETVPGQLSWTSPPGSQRRLAASPKFVAIEAKRTAASVGQVELLVDFLKPLQRDAGHAWASFNPSLEPGRSPLHCSGAPERLPSEVGGRQKKGLPKKGAGFTWVGLAPTDRASFAWLGA